MKQVVLFIHGIGNQNPGFAEECRQGLEKRLKKSLGNNSQIIYREVVWAHELSSHQNLLWTKVKEGDGKKDLDMVKLRKFMIHFAGDAIAYRNDAQGQDLYEKIHSRVQEKLVEASQEAGEPYELSVIAHSLGSVIASDFLYDQKETYPITNFFTLGSPIALWLLRNGDPTSAIQPIQVQENGEWINILDDEDIIGYPLKGINEQYNRAVGMDYVTEIGGLLRAGTPLSHTGYWSDRNALAPISKKLELDYLRLNQGTAYSREEYFHYIRSLLNI